MPDDVLEMAYELGKSSQLVFPFGVGEPLLHPRLKNVVQRFKSLGNSVLIFTNAMLLGEKLAEDLISAGLDVLNISFDAAERNSFERIRAGSDFDRICRNIRMFDAVKTRLRAANPTVTLNAVVQKSNLDQLPRIVDLAAELSVRHVFFLPLVIHEYIQGLENEDISGDLPRLGFVLDECRRRAEKRNVSIDFERLEYMLTEKDPLVVYRNAPTCPEPFRYLGIGADGSLFPCCSWDLHAPLGSTADSDIESLWFGEKFRALRKRLSLEDFPAVCHRCMRSYYRPLVDHSLC
jgi:MoaA/NifB/PqqE/SkfB family radical SAM enzyme